LAHMYLSDSLNPANFYRQLSGLALLYALFLMVVTIYVFYRLAAIVLRLLAIVGERYRNLHAAGVQLEVEQMQQGLGSLRQLLLFSFYLFCFCLFILLRISFHTFGEKIFGVQILQGFYLYFGFAADICLIFLSLHTLLWVVPKRVDRALLKESAKRAEAAA